MRLQSFEGRLFPVENDMYTAKLSNMEIEQRHFWTFKVSKDFPTVRPLLGNLWRRTSTKVS